MANTPDLKELMQMAQEMQKSMKEAHDDLSRQKYTGRAGGGLVAVTLNGRHEVPPRGVTIDPKAINEGLEVLEDLIAAAINAATREVEKASEKKMLDLTKKLGIPGAGDQGGSQTNL